MYISYVSTFVLIGIVPLDKSHQDHPKGALATQGRPSATLIRHPALLSRSWHL
jgi:hypothetical protein